MDAPESSARADRCYRSLPGLTPSIIERGVRRASGDLTDATCARRDSNPRPPDEKLVEARFMASDVVTRSPDDLR
jgi:hypothetical protein